ncbi:hypothetical protein CHS0354_031355 [Potamilus streckersoni]|uniref:Uncharacterized protein n=1 Tax=Potamilus streckersoni TaxID=2493646 RepID=A0AAE0VY56_9BIVA|nr:hypothetical protein CHS0354_031355 [Potamilus streckersoni]
MRGEKRPKPGKPTTHTFQLQILTWNQDHQSRYKHHKSYYLQIIHIICSSSKRTWRPKQTLPFRKHPQFLNKKKTEILREMFKILLIRSTKWTKRRNEAYHKIPLTGLINFAIEIGKLHGFMAIPEGTYEERCIAAKVCKEEQRRKIFWVPT